MRSCKQIAKSLATGESLSLMTKLETKMHMLICDFCKVYSNQIKAIEKNFAKLMKSKSQVDESKLKNLEKEIIQNTKK